MFIALSRTLPIQVLTQQVRLPQRSSHRTQADCILALRPSFNPTEGYTMAYRRSEGPSLASPIHPSLSFES